MDSLGIFTILDLRITINSRISYLILLIFLGFLSCKKKEYVEKIIVFENQHCVQRGTTIWTDEKKIGKIVDIHEENGRFIATAKIVKEFHMYYSIMPYILSANGEKCELVFETKNATVRPQTDTLFLTEDIPYYN